MGTPVLARCSLRLSWAMLAISSSSSRLTLRSLSSRRPRPTRNLCASSYSTAGSGARRECKKAFQRPRLAPNSAMTCGTASAAWASKSA